MKFKVIDEETKTEYSVEEVEKPTEPVLVKTEEPETHDDDSSLSPEEIASLKSLAAVADKLVALIKEDSCESPAEPETLDADEDEDDDETVVDTESCGGKACDSKSSLGKIEKSPKQVNDSAEEMAQSIEDAWAKRYNGGNK